MERSDTRDQAAEVLLRRGGRPSWRSNLVLSFKPSIPRRKCSYSSRSTPSKADGFGTKSNSLSPGKTASREKSSFPFVLMMLSFTVRQVGQHLCKQPATLATSLIGKTMGLTNRHSLRCCDISKSPRHQRCSVILIYFGPFYVAEDNASPKAAPSRCWSFYVANLMILSLAHLRKR